MQLNEDQLISVHDCNKKISKLALVCPYCGLPIPALRQLFSREYGGFKDKRVRKIENFVVNILGYCCLAGLAYILYKWGYPLYKWLLIILDKSGHYLGP